MPRAVYIPYAKRLLCCVLLCQKSQLMLKPCVVTQICDLPTYERFLATSCERNTDMRPEALVTAVLCQNTKYN